MEDSKKLTIDDIRKLKVDVEDNVPTARLLSRYYLKDRFEFSTMLSTSNDTLISDDKPLGTHNININIAEQTTSKIEDTDKVFFGKESAFPRTSFNKLSNKARLVQRIDKADKVVVGSRIGIMFSKYVLLKILDNTTGKVYHMLIDDYFAELNTEDAGSTPKTLLDGDVSKEFKYTVVDYLNGIYDYGLKDVTIEWRKVRKLGDTTKEKDTAKLIMNTSISADKFITDKEVNDYINKFKGEFDELTYNYVLEAFNSTEDPDVAIQLLGQLNIERDNPLFNALMFNIKYDRRYVISQSKAMKSIDALNMNRRLNLKTRIEDNLTRIEDYLNSAGIYINSDVSTEDRETYFRLIKDTLETSATDSFSRYYNSKSKYKFKISYENITNEDR